MTPAAFVAKRPCLEEIDGYIMHKDLSGAILTPALKKLVDTIADMRRNTPPAGLEVIDQDGLRLINDWRKLLLAGKDVPNPTTMDRAWIYVRGRKPVKQRMKP